MILARVRASVCECVSACALNNAKAFLNYSIYGLMFENGSLPTKNEIIIKKIFLSVTTNNLSMR